MADKRVGRVPAPSTTESARKGRILRQRLRNGAGAGPAARLGSRSRGPHEGHSLQRGVARSTSKALPRHMRHQGLRRAARCLMARVIGRSTRPNRMQFVAGAAVIAAGLWRKVEAAIVRALRVAIAGNDGELELANIALWAAVAAMAHKSGYEPEMHGRPVCRPGPIDSGKIFAAGSSKLVSRRTRSPAVGRGFIQPKCSGGDLRSMSATIGQSSRRRFTPWKEEPVKRFRTPPGRHVRYEHWGPTCPAITQNPGRPLSQIGRKTVQRLGYTSILHRRTLRAVRG